jgi:trinucleotide repeat-containing gene 6 protein
LKAFYLYGPGVNNAPSLLNNQSATLASINNISPAIVQKIIAQQPPPQQPPTQQQNAFNQAPRPPQNQPSTAQLRMLVQQIQMAVQAGYLNHQVREGESMHMCMCEISSIEVVR